MFDNLQQRLSKITAGLSGRARLSEDNVAEALRDVRRALLEGDVALPVVNAFVERVQTRAVGQEVLGTLTPGQSFIGVVRDELTAIMGANQTPLQLNDEPPAVILMAGLQGSGKTTSAAKLARFLMQQERKSVSMVSCDV